MYYLFTSLTRSLITNTKWLYIGKELAKIHTAIINLFKAVENGFYSNTTNTRIQEFEKRKAELTEYIATEKTKEIQPLVEK